MIKLSLFTLLVVLCTQTVRAGQQIAESKTVCPEQKSMFDAGTAEIEVGGGGFAQLGKINRTDRPDYGLAIGQAQIGYMLNTPRGRGIFRGNTELLLEVLGGGFYKGPANGLGGGLILIRYNFVQPNSAFCPFFQFGGGGVYSDAAAADHVQHIIGANVSFVLEAEAGVRVKLSETWSLIGGPELLHISNAGAARRNFGLNALGGEIGLSHAF